MDSVRVILAVLLISLAATASAQKLYRWVDENGRTHYSQTPPTDQQRQRFESADAHTGRQGDIACCRKVREFGSSVAKALYRGMSLLDVQKAISPSSSPHSIEIVNFVSAKRMLELDVASIDRMTFDACLSGSFQVCRATEQPDAGEPRRAAGSSGTGFFVTPDVLVTNHHVIEGCRDIRIGGQRLPAELIAQDNRLDLAALRSTRYISEYARFRRGRTVSLGETAVVVGYPLSGILTSVNVTSGNVSSLTGLHNDTRVFQLTAPIQPGNSGGPVLDDKGGVIGVVVAKLNELYAARASGSLPQNVNFAIQPNVVATFLEGHGIPYSLADPERMVMPVRTISAEATEYTVNVVCAQ